jgi:hypothetical protein
LDNEYLFENYKTKKDTENIWLFRNEKKIRNTNGPLKEDANEYA